MLQKDLKESEQNVESCEKQQGFVKPHSIKPEKKHFRTHNETPTYTGGVSKEAQSRLEERHNREKQRFVNSYSSKVKYFSLSNYKTYSWLLLRVKKDFKYSTYYLLLDI